MGYRCPWCLRDTYNPNDIEHSFCPCCGDETLSKRDCEHRTGKTLSQLWQAGVTRVRREPWADGNWLELLRAGGMSPHFGIIGLVHSPLEWERPDGSRWAGRDYLPAQQVVLFTLPLAGWEEYTGPVSWPDDWEPPRITDLGEGAFLVNMPEGVEIRRPDRDE
jgi:hypothetical protein